MALAPNYIKARNKEELRFKSLKEDSKVLQDIIIRFLRCDIREKNRFVELVDARKIYSILMYERNHPLVGIGRILNKHHSSVIHYIKSAEDLLTTDPEFRDKYIRVKDEFSLQKPDDFQSAVVKETDTFKLRNLLERLILEHSNLQDRNEKYKRLDKIIDLLDSVTPQGQESLMERRIKNMLIE